MVGSVCARFERAALEEGRHLIAIVDDDTARRRWLKHRIMRSGYRALEFSGAQALMDYWDAATIDPGSWAIPDLILARAELPEGSGLEILAHVRHEDWYTPVILLTDSETRPIVRQEAQRLGASFVDLPGDWNDVAERLACLAPLAPHTTVMPPALLSQVAF